MRTPTENPPIMATMAYTVLGIQLKESVSVSDRKSQRLGKH